METSRRSFFGMLGAVAAAVAVPFKLPRLIWRNRQVGPDIVVAAGETLTLPPGEYGWVRVYGSLVAQDAKIKRLDVMDCGSVGFEAPGRWQCLTVCDTKTIEFTNSRGDKIVESINYMRPVLTQC